MLSRAEPGSTLTAARELGVEVLDQAGLLALLAGESRTSTGRL